MEGAIKGRLTSARKLWSERISCKGQSASGGLETVHALEKRHRTGGVSALWGGTVTIFALKVPCSY